MDWISVILLAAAVSFDSLAIGVTYGMAQIRIPTLPRILLSIISAIFLLVAMAIGGIITIWLSKELTSVLGGLILVLLGCYSIWRTRQQANTQHNVDMKPAAENPSLLYNIRIPFFGLIIHVIREPLAADYDSSKTISISEALILGFALALDAFAAGIGAAILGFPTILTATAVMVSNFLFVSKGLHTGRLLQQKMSNFPLQWLPGTMIILLGVLKIVT